MSAPQKIVVAILVSEGGPIQDPIFTTETKDMSKILEEAVKQVRELGTLFHFQVATSHNTRTAFGGNDTIPSGISGITLKYDPINTKDPDFIAFAKKNAC